MQMIANAKIVTRDALSATATFQTAANTVNMKLYPRCLVALWIYGSGAGTGAVTLKQSTVAAGTDAKALGFTDYWYSADYITLDSLTKGAATSNTFNAVAVNAKLSCYFIEVKADALDVDNDFTFLRCDVANVANAVGHLQYLLYEARYAKGADAMPSAIS